MELFNESFLLFTIYVMHVLSAWVQDVDLKEKIGYFYQKVFLGVVAINFLMVFIEFLFLLRIKLCLLYRAIAKKLGPIIKESRLYEMY